MHLKREDVERVARAGGDAAAAQALAMFELIGDHAERIEKLERRLSQNSRNSSRAPSTDRPEHQEGEKPERQRKGSGRKRGAQDGHDGAGRGLDADPDEIVEHRPTRCRKRGRELDGSERVVGRPARHQVIELPETVVDTTEHQLLKVVCGDCGTHTRAESCPPGSSRAPLGRGCERRS